MTENQPKKDTYNIKIRYCKDRRDANLDLFKNFKNCFKKNKINKIVFDINDVLDKLFEIKGSVIPIDKFYKRNVFSNILSV